MEHARGTNEQDESWNPDDLHELVRQLDDALATEEAHVAGESGLIEPTSARLIVGRPGRYQYRFGFGSRPKSFRAGNAVWMKRGKEERRATIVAHTRSEIRIEVEEELSGSGLDWRFRRDVGFFYQVVRKRLAELWPRGRGASKSDDLIRALQCGADVSRANPIEDPDVAGLNEAQAHAVRTACTRRVTFIFGPPGTGKSETVAVLARELVRAGRSALIVAMTNQAADVAASRIAGHLLEDPRLDQGLVQRPGYPGPELRARWGDRLVPDQLVERLRAERHAAELELRALSMRAASLGTLQALVTPIADARLSECIGRITDRAASRAQTLHELVRRPLPRGAVDAQVVVTTIHQLILNRELASMTWDTVIVDEGSQVPRPHALIAASHAHCAAVIVGDPKQLGPTISSSDPEVRRLLGTDLFRASGVLTSGSPALVQLCVQHRMAPAICRLVSELWYGGALVCAPEVMIRPPSRIQAALGSLLWVDTGAWAPRVARAGGSRVNAAHAGLVREVVDDLLRRGLVEAETSILVMSPYRAQVGELEGRLRNTPHRATTAHGAQGDESPIAFVDLCDAVGLPPGHFMRSESIDDVGVRLLTVAASRARECLIVAGPYSYLRQYGGPAMRTFVDALQKHGRSYDLVRKAAA